MNIYPFPSTKVRPYVYFGYNPVTGEFYIGYREANTKPSHLDLFEYRTSSKIVQPFFDQMIWTILAEFENGDDAFDFEQRLIGENWNNSLLLNKQYRLPNGRKRFKSKKGCNKGKVPWNKGIPQTAEQREKNAISHRGQGKGIKKGPFTNEHKKKLSAAHRGISKGPMSTEHKTKIGLSNKGVSRHRSWTKEEKLTWGAARRGENNPMYGRQTSDETKRKQSLKAIGRKDSIETKEKKRNAQLLRQERIRQSKLQITSQSSLTYLLKSS